MPPRKNKPTPSRTAPARKPSTRKAPATVRKSLTVDAAKLEQARQLLGVSNDADVLRKALDFLLQNHKPASREEE